jgi:hypothetical protein
MHRLTKRNGIELTNKEKKDIRERNFVDPEEKVLELMKLSDA